MNAYLWDPVKIMCSRRKGDLFEHVRIGKWRTEVKQDYEPNDRHHEDS